MRLRGPVAQIVVALFGVGGVAAAMLAPSQKTPSKPKLKYSRDILPILADKCFKCHGPDAGSRMAGMRLDTSEGAFADRSGTFPIVPGHPEHSLVVKRIHSTTSPMPPPGSGKSLSKEEIATITQWIAEGAKYGKLWSFEPIPAVTPVPKIASTWPKDDIDYFVLEKLKQQHLSPSAPASKLRWLRRVTYDLTGLPPTEKEVDAFQADNSPKTFDHVVDRLLASSHFGERVATDWLDAARYSDSYGYQSDLLSPTWPYRDWVIKSFNQNLPYDKFLTYQLAGDLLPNATRDERLATAFNRLHRQSNEGGSIPLEYKTEYAADRVSTYGTAMLGMTLNCARCHDHKFDPITQKEFYQLFAYFDSINEYGLLMSSEVVPTPSMLLPTPAQDAKLSALRLANIAAQQKLQATIKGSESRFQQWLATKPSTLSIPEISARFDFSSEDKGKFASLEAGKPIAEKLDKVDTVPGISGSKAVLFDGDSGLAVRSLASRDRWDPFTWSFALNDPRSSKGPIVLLHRTGGTDVGFCGFDLMLDKGYVTARVFRAWPGNAVAIRSTTQIPQSQWAHLAWSWDGSGRASGLALYLNGQILPSEVLNDKLWKKINAYGDLGLAGGDWSFAQRFRDLGFRDGKVADVVYADRALSPLEVASLSDGHSLKDALADPSNHASALRGYFASAIDKPSRQADAAMRMAQHALTDEEDGVYEAEVMEETAKPVPTYLLARGLYDAPRTEKSRVYRDVPKILPPLRLMATGRARNDRLSLAEWTVRSDNPLTSRVAVNRFWQMLFGSGIVDTSENFGVQGSRPTHPELLDYLARKFINSGWNVKALLREIVLSATYRQDSVRNPKLNKIDPDNRLLARGPSFRLSAEMVRDTALEASGLLVDKVGGPPVNPYQPAGLWTENNGMTQSFVQSKGEGLYRRSIYSTVKRTTPVPSMLLFDATAREACSVKRPTTNTPMQALVLLNDIQFVEAARVLAQKTMESTKDIKVCIQTAFRRLAGREPDARELDLLRRTFEEQDAQYQKDAKSADQLVHEGDTKPPATLAAPELAAMTVTVQTIMNSDSVVWRR